MSTSHHYTTRLTPTSTQGRGKLVEHNDGSLCFVAEVVIGSSVLSINSLSASTETNTFAFCAGAIVVLAVINSELSLDQRLVCVKPDALPIQATPSYYNHATPTKAAGNRNYINSPFKDDSPFGPALTNNKADPFGYCPRVLIFSVATATSTDLPLACLTEHTFGVRALAFSPDSRWLCSLGDLHDGGFFLWSINPKTGTFRLDSSNRCTTADTIAWMGMNVVSVGTRHVKVWRLEQISSPAKSRRGLESISDGSSASPIPRTFTGRNCLLGSLQDAVFSCVVGISDDKAVLCTQDGTVCLLDDASRTQRLLQVTKKDYSITCVTLDPSAGVVWIGGKGVEPEALPLDVLLHPKQPPPELGKSSRIVLDEVEKPDIAAMCCINNRVITIDTSHCIAIYNSLFIGDDAPRVSVINRLPSHDSAVLGVVILPKSNKRRSDFLTYSENGRVLYWRWNGTCTNSHLVQLVQPLEQDSTSLNSLRTLGVAQTPETLLTGDKAGVLRLSNVDEGTEIRAKAHDGEIYDLVLQRIEGDDSIAASCGRDRTIQIFRISQNECVLQQSLVNEHAGPIRKLELADNANILASMSSDRTIVLHHKVLRTDNSIAFVSIKVITLKASPVTMSLIPGTSPTLLVSTADRCIRKISLTQGNIIDSFKASDRSGGEPVVLNRLSVGASNQLSAHGNVFAGFSSLDGSIRLYCTETGLLLAAVQGQTPISDLAIAEAPDHDDGICSKVVCTGIDGTTTIWHLTSSPSHSGLKHGSGGIDPSKSQARSVLRPLRRVLSKTEIADFQRTLKDGGDAGLSPRSLSPSQVRKKPSRNAIEDVFKLLEAKPQATGTTSNSVSGSDRDHVKLIRASPPSSPKVELQSGSQRSSLSELPGTMAAGSDVSDVCTINSVAKRSINILQEFRKQVATSKENLDYDLEQGIKKELHAISNALAQRALSDSKGKGAATDCESFDDYLARLIDDRLALRLRTDDQKKNDGEKVRCGGRQWD
ncbi:MAG: hypothetical protein Q9202_001041 [Teloschistes flavicans]